MMLTAPAARAISASARTSSTSKSQASGRALEVEQPGAEAAAATAA